VALCNLLEAFLSEKFGFKNSKEEKLEEKKKFIRYAFAFAYIWSIASSVEDRF
jgi:dynein heavy chain